METTPETESLGEHLEAIAAALRTWRGETPSSPREHRDSAGTAVREIDAMLYELHALRNRMIGMAREFDEETMRRAEAILGRSRAARRERIATAAELADEHARHERALQAEATRIAGGAS